MALVSGRAHGAGSAWAIGALSGPTVGGGLADAFGDPAPFVLCCVLCAATLLVLAARGRRTLRTA